MKFLESTVGKLSIVIILIGVALTAGWYLAQLDTGASEELTRESALQHSVKHLDPKYQCPMHPDIVKDKEGSCPICGMDLELLKQQDNSSSPREKRILYWVAPMDANYRRDEPGKSPMGMDLVPVYDDGDSSDASASTVKISPAVENNLGVRTALVQTGKLWRKIDTVGYVGLDESKVSHIHLRVDGWIEKLAISVEGERVNKGQRLFDVYSPKLVNAMEEYMQALRVSNRRLVSASQEKLLSLGVSERQIKQLEKTRKIPRTISVYAPQDGIITMMMVREGMYVKPTTQVLTLADLSSVWVLAEVFESQSQWVKTGQSADVELSFIPGRTWEGVVDYVYPSLDPQNRTLRVRLRFDNPEELLKPNMYASVSIFGGALDNVLSVPREALIRSGNTERLIIARGDGRYQQRVVVAGIESGEWVEIRSGVSAGDMIVTSAHFLIDSEASMKASLLRMSESQVSVTETSEVTDKATASGVGTITNIMPEHAMITLRHDAIEDLGWPQMTMDFTTREGVSLAGLRNGDSVAFDLMKVSDEYLISAIRKQGENE